MQSIVGYSEPAVAAYILAVAKQATNPSALASELQQHGLPPGAKTAEFATDLYTKMPRQQAVSKMSALR